MLYFIFQLRGHTPSLREVRPGTQGENLEAVTEAEDTEECGLLACLRPHNVLSLQSYTQDHMPKVTSHSGLYPLM